MPAGTCDAPLKDTDIDGWFTMAPAEPPQVRPSLSTSCTPTGKSPA